MLPHQNLRGICSDVHVYPHESIESKKHALYIVKEKCINTLSAYSVSRKIYPWPSGLMSST